jgi:hypothetical protein
MSEDVWHLKAEHEKLQHMRRYPNYKVTLAPRTPKLRKRNVKRVGENEVLQCCRVADLLLAGKEGQALALANGRGRGQMEIMKLMTIRLLWKRLVFTGRNSLGTIWKNFLYHFVAHCSPFRRVHPLCL